MVYHVLNGDALVDRFKATGLTGEMIVARECLIEGDLKGDTVQEFLENRAHFIEDEFNEARIHYYDNVVHEFEKLLNAEPGSEFNLWFGYDLFCQANMWFIISLISHLEGDKEIYVVYPSFRDKHEIWLEFGRADVTQLQDAYNKRTRFQERDLRLADDLWIAYKHADLARLNDLSIYTSPCFPYLQDVCSAHIDRFPYKGRKGRPERVMEDILKKNVRDFRTAFIEFTAREGVYGFGDDQVRKIFDKVLKEKFS